MTRSQYAELRTKEIGNEMDEPPVWTLAEKCAFWIGVAGVLVIWLTRDLP